MSVVSNENIEELWSLLKTYIDEYLVSKNNLPSHASPNTTYGVGSSSNYGHVKLSDSTTSTSGVSSGVAATPAAVKSVKAIAEAAKTAADNASSAGKSAIPQYAYGTLHFTTPGGNDATSTYKVINFTPSIIKVYFVGNTSSTGDPQLCTVLTPPSSYTNTGYKDVTTTWKGSELVNGSIAQISKGKTYYWQPKGSAGYYVYEIMGYKETT